VCVISVRLGFILTNVHDLYVKLTAFYFKLHYAQIIYCKPVSGDKHKSFRGISKRLNFFSNNIFVNTQQGAPHPLDEANVCVVHTMANVCDVILANVHDLYVKIIIFYFKLRHTQVLYLFKLCLWVV